MIRVNVDSRRAVAIIDGLGERLKDLTPAFRNFQAYMVRRTALTFSRNRRGGSFRGADWPGFADQYTRATDGATVPAHGGVKKLRGKGVVKGRLRHSGKRVTKQSSLMRDTGRLANAALLVQRIRRGTVLEMDTPVAYAAAQHERRPFQFFEDPPDINALRRFIVKELANAGG